MSHEVPKLYDQKPKLDSISKNFDNFALLFEHVNHFFEVSIWKK
jgi:hypothetical protein